MLTRTLLILAIFGFIAIPAFSQQADIDAFNARKDQIGKRSMFALGGWAVGNFAVSGALLTQTSGADFHFHEMNVYWNVVNAGLAGVGLLGLRKGSAGKSWQQTVDGHYGTEKIYLLNAGLDVGYIMSGLFLTELANRMPDQRDRFTGWGYSMMVQGGFLLVLDAVMYAIYRGHYKKNLSPILNNLEVSPMGMRLRF